MVILTNITMVTYRNGRRKGLFLILFPTRQDRMTLNDGTITNRNLLSTSRKTARIMNIGMITQMSYKILDPEGIEQISDIMEI